MRVCVCVCIVCIYIYIYIYAGSKELKLAQQIKERA